MNLFPHSGQRSIGPRLPSGSLSPGDRFEILERLSQAATLERDADTRLLMTLDALQSGLRADLVLVQGQDSGSEAPPDRQVGARQSALWCAQVTRVLLERLPEDQDTLLVPLLDPGKLPIPAPRSAALARLSRSRGVWLVALRFPPGLAFQPTDLCFLSLVRNLFLQAQQQEEQAARSQELLVGLVRGLVGALDRRYLQAGHSDRVAQMAAQIGSILELPPRECEELYLAGLLHDAGQIDLEDGYGHPAESSAGEAPGDREAHVLAGEALVAQVPQLARLAPLIRHHHEHFDGTGYPDGLRGEAIPLAARILALADAVDVEIAGDSWCKAQDRCAMLALLMRGRGRQWDPLVVDAFLSSVSSPLEKTRPPLSG
jgi:hypothetical protein